MKKIISMALTLILVVSVFSCIGMTTLANTPDSLTTNEIAQIVDSNVYEGSIVYENDFSSGTVPVTMREGNPGDVNEVADGRWHMQCGTTNNALGTASGLSGKTLGDFIIAFEFETVQNGGSYNFFFHDTWGGPGTHKSEMVVAHKGSGEYTITLKNNGGEATSTVNMWANKKYNIVLKSVGTTASLYIFEKGTEIPTAPVATAVANEALTGDFYLYAYKVNCYIDNVKVFDPNLNPLTVDNIANITGEDISDREFVYQNDFSSGTVPVTMREGNPGDVNEVADGRWHMQCGTTNNALGTASGLSGKTLGDFIIAFEFETVQNGGSYNFFFHDTWGGPGTHKSEMVVAHKGSGEYTITLKNNGGEATSTVNMWANKKYNIVLKSVGTTASLYIFEKGTEIPTAPVATAVANEALTGDFYLYAYKVNCYIDNVKIFNRNLNPLTTEKISSVIDEEISDKELIYQSDFSSGDVPVVTFADNYLGDVNEIVDGKWHWKGTEGMASNEAGLVKKTVGDFVIAYEFEAKVNAGEIHFYFHDTTGWPGNFHRSYLALKWDTDAFRIEFKNNGVEGASDVRVSANKVYNIVIKSIGKTASAYIWEKGTIVPTEPSITATASEEETGDFYLYTWDADNYFDNIKVYDTYSLTHTAPTASEPKLRFEFVSGIEFAFDYAPTDDDGTLIGYGIKLFDGVETKDINLSNVANINDAFSFVATGMEPGTVIEAYGYVAVRDSKDVEHFVYSDTVTADVDSLGYVKALYGDANDDKEVDICDLVRLHLNLTDETATVNKTNVDFDGSGIIDVEDLTMTRKILLYGKTVLVPADVNYVNY